MEEKVMWREVGQKMLAEAGQFLLALKPYGLLVNCEVPYNLSFLGAKEIGKHPLQHKTAIFNNSDTDELQNGMKLALDIRKSDGDYSRKVFTDRDEAIKWLSDI